MSKAVKVLALVIIGVFCAILEAQASVLAQKTQRLYGAHFWFYKRKFPTQTGYVMTDFGPGNIKFLERIDIVVDKDQTVNGILIVYKTPDGIQRKVFLRNVQGWTFEFPPSPNAVSKDVLIRVVNPEMLIEP